MLFLRLIDTHGGVAAANASYEISFSESGTWQLMKEGRTGDDGLATLADRDANIEPGYYELTLFLGEYFAVRGYPLAGRKFVDIVPVRFGLNDVEADTFITVSISPFGFAVSKS